MEQARQTTRDISTQLTRDYIDYCLVRSGYTPPPPPPRAVGQGVLQLPRKTFAIMCDVAQQMAVHYHQQFGDPFNHVASATLLSRHTFFRFADEVINQRLTPFRLVALISFAGTLAAERASTGNMDDVNLISQLLGNYVGLSLHSQLERQGGIIAFLGTLKPMGNLRKEQLHILLLFALFLLYASLVVVTMYTVIFGK